LTELDSPLRTISIGKYGSFLTSELIGKHYDVTYEVVMPSGAGSSSELPSRAGTPAPDSNAMDVDREETSVSEVPVTDGNKKGKKAVKYANLKGKDREPVIDVSEVKLLPIRPPRMEELGKS
jgi:tRNA (adenine-N(1)-)-methyltransferase non-catalytic subunit